MGTVVGVVGTLGTTAGTASGTGTATGSGGVGALVLTADSRRIRVRDLLNHTAGFVTDDPWGDQ